MQLELFSGFQRKELGQAQVLENDESWKEIALEAIRSLAQMRESFSSDDLRELVDGYAIPHHPNAIGGVFSTARKLKIIKQTGRYTHSKIPSCHGRLIALWEKA